LQSDLTTKDFIRQSALNILDLDTSEIMVIWSLRHWATCSITGEEPKELFTVCREQHQLPDISILIETVVYGIAEGANEKGPIGGELCDHVHYGEFKILEALFMLQNDMYDDAKNSLFGWLKKYQGKKILKCLNALSAFLDEANLIIPPRVQYRNNLLTH
tara:strand:- start:242 stop:721 length:480 start_codon:yes stop_codon:yes gene_type:complete